MARRLSTLLLLVIALIACGREPALPPEVVARVGSRNVTLADFKRYLERNTGTDLAQLVPEAASALLDQHLQEVLLSEYAASRGIEISAEEVAGEVRRQPGSTVTEKRDQLRRDALLSEIVAEMPPPTPEQVRAHYQQFIRDFRFEERVRLSQILVPDEDLASRIVRELSQGASFAELSARHSVAPNAAGGGEIGWITRPELPPVFEGEIFALSSGEWTSPIRTDTGFYIFYISDRKPAGTLEFEAAEPMIRQRIAEEAARKRLANTLIAARQKVDVSVLARRLPFDYSGTLPASSAE
ncbi:MAG: peptidyl-prolyl cis-trans isomerase [Thermoanaerobaculia bacterium]